MLLEIASSNPETIIKGPEKGSKGSCLSLSGCLPVCMVRISDGHMKVPSVSFPLFAYYSTLPPCPRFILPPTFELEPQGTHFWPPRRVTVGPYIPQSGAPIKQGTQSCNYCWL